jgi:hypothetical protein
MRERPSPASRFGRLLSAARRMDPLDDVLREQARERHRASNPLPKHHCSGGSRSARPSLGRRLVEARAAEPAAAPEPLLAARGLLRSLGLGRRLLRLGVRLRALLPGHLGLLSAVSLAHPSGQGPALRGSTPPGAPRVIAEDARVELAPSTQADRRSRPRRATFLARPTACTTPRACRRSVRVRQATCRGMRELRHAREAAAHFGRNGPDEWATRACAQPVQPLALSRPEGPIGRFGTGGQNRLLSWRRTRAAPLRTERSHPERRHFRFR